MKINELNDGLAVRYLLGDLPEEPAEAIDELTVADREAFELLSAAENDLVDRYVNGELADRDLALFESNYLASPLRREKVVLARSLQEFAGRHVGREDDSTITVAERQNDEKKGVIAGFFASLGIFGGGQPAFRFAVAACGLLVAVLGGWIVFSRLNSESNGEIAAGSNINNNRPDLRPSPTPVETITAPTPAVTATSVSPTPPADNIQTKSTPAKMPTPVSSVKAVIASFILAPPLRGGAAPAVKVPADAERASVKVELEPDEFKSYSAELKDQSSGRVIWRSVRRAASGKGTSRYLALSIPAKSLNPGAYTLTVSGSAEDGAVEIVGDYPFRVVR